MYEKTINANSAVSISVIQKAFQTPPAPTVLLRMKADGRITITYLNSDMQSDVPPFPSPSSAPETVTLSEEGINPIHIILSAAVPILIASSDELKDLSDFAAVRQTKQCRAP